MRLAVLSRSCLVAVAGLLASVPASRAAEPVFTEFTAGVTPNSLPTGVALGPDGNLWMAEARAPGRIAKVTPAGAVTEFPVGPGHVPLGAARGPDGNLWFTDDTSDGGVLKVTPGGVVTAYPRNIRAGSFSMGITAGPDGNLWFTENASPGRITRVTTAGDMATMAYGGDSPGFSANSQPRSITTGPDGNLWFTEFAAPGRIGRITPAGVVTEFPIAPPGPFSVDRQPVGITTGPDGALWFTEASGRIGRITTAGVVTEFAVPGSQPNEITAGPDGALWFTEPVSPGAIGRITTAGVVTRFVAGETPGFTADRGPSGITTGADGNLWFSEGGNPGAIVRIGLSEPEPEPTATPTPTVAATATAIPGPGPAPLQPRVTALTSHVPMVAGSQALLEAEVLGTPKQINWDLNGDGSTEVSCPGNQTTLTFRPSARTGAARAAALGSVSVRAVDAAGLAGPAMSQTFEVAPPVPAKANRIRDAVIKLTQEQPQPYVCGVARDLRPGSTYATLVPPGLPCVGKTIHAGTLTVSGCLATVGRLTDIPEAEKGIVTDLWRDLNLSTRPRSNQAATADFGILATGIDGFVATDRVLVNGVTVDPAPGAAIVVYTQANKIVSSNAVMTVGGIPLQNQTGFSLDTRPVSGGEIRFAPVARVPGPRTLGGLALPVRANVQMTFLPGTPERPGGTRITTSLKLPAIFSLGLGAGAVADVTLRVTPGGELELDDMKIALPSVSIGVMDVSDLELAFSRKDGDSVWEGHAKVCILEACVSAAAPNGGVWIRNGRFERAFVSVHLNPAIPLYHNVNLTDVGAGLELNPTAFFGSVGVTALEIYKINGRVAIAFPTKGQPFRLTRDKLDGLTQADYDRSYTRFTIAAAGEAFLQLPVIDQNIKLGSGYFLYQFPGYVHVGGEISEPFGGVFTFSGRTEGEFNLGNGKFNFGQDLELCVFEWGFCRTVTSRISSAGVGGCVSLALLKKSITVGAGVTFDPFDVKIYGYGCRWSRFEDRAVFGGKAAAAQADGSFTVRIKRGDPSRSVRLDGVDGAPRVRVSAPDGQVLESAATGMALTPALRILSLEKVKQTVVGLFEPKPGIYRIDLLPGSPRIAKVSESEDPGPPRVSVRVRGTGARRTLEYDVARRDDQKVTFVEVAAGGRRPIGTVTGGRGKLSFTPAPGTDRRRIEAQFELAGIGAETQTVAAFSPPSQHLGRPGRVTVRRSGTRLLVRWTPVAQAERYEVVTTPAGGGQRITRTRRANVTLAGVAASSSGEVRVSAVAPMRQGKDASARFRATAPLAAPRFKPLGRYR